MEHKTESLIVFAAGLLVLYIFYWHRERGTRITGSIITLMGMGGIVLSFSAIETVLIILFGVSGTIFLIMNFPIMKGSGITIVRIDDAKPDAEEKGG